MTFRIAVAGWHRRGAPIEAECEQRAADLGVNVSTECKSGRFPGWLVRVRKVEDCICGTDSALAAGETSFARASIVCPKHDLPQVVDLRSEGEGSPWPVIAAALDDWQIQYTDAPWTPEELVVVANQSGIPVERA